MAEPTDIGNTGLLDGQPPGQSGRVSLLSIMLSWGCFGTGDFISRTIKPVLGRWFEWPYRIYNKLMVWSVDLQSTIHAVHGT